MVHYAYPKSIVFKVFLVILSTNYVKLSVKMIQRVCVILMFIKL